MEEPWSCAGGCSRQTQVHRSEVRAGLLVQQQEASVAGRVNVEQLECCQKDTD